MIDTRTHGIIDYLTGTLLILAPYLFGFATGGIEQWLPQILGVMIIGMSLLTNYELSVAKVIPLKAHLAVDVLGALSLPYRRGSSGSPTSSGGPTCSSG